MLRRSIVFLLALGLPAIPSADLVTVGGERVLATVPDEEHYFLSPDSAPLGGEFVVTWGSYFTRYSGSQPIDWASAVLGRRVAANGLPVGGRLTLVPEEDKIDITASAVAADRAGRMAVVWNRDSEGHPQLSHWLRQYAPGGTPLPAVRLEQFGPLAYPTEMAVAFGTAGRTLAVWGRQAPAPPAWPPGLVGRLFRPSGSPLGPRFGVASRPVSRRRPGLGTDARGNVVLVYASPAADNASSTLYFRLFGPDGQPRGSETRLATVPGLEPGAALSVQADGRFVVVWQDFGHIRARIFAPPNRPLGPALEVGAGDAYGSSPDVALGRDGRFVVTWFEYSTTAPVSLSIRARGFDAVGAPLGPSVRVDRGPFPDNSGYGIGPTVAVSESGTYLVSWVRPEYLRNRVVSRLCVMAP